MTALSRLRTNDSFNPDFVWQTNVYLGADLINSFPPGRLPEVCRPHRGGPPQPLEHPLAGQGWPHNSHLQSLHHAIFQGDKPSDWRKVRVIVGRHRPPGPEEVPALMRELRNAYRLKPTTYENLINWYRDFETIHPFIDGNGRVGCCVAALISYRKNFNEGQFFTSLA